MLANILCVLTGVHLLSACVSIYSIKGMVGLVPLNSGCTFLLNGYPTSAMNLTTYRSYGLIQASCSDCIVSHVSMLTTCDDCWICAHNEGILPCKSRIVPIVSGVVATLLAIGLLVSLTLLLESKLGLMNRFALWITHKLEGKRVRKTIKRDKRVETVLIKHLASGESRIHPSPKIVDEALTPARRPVTPPPGRSLGGSVAPAVLIALGLATSPVSTCDDVLFVSSSGALYTDGALTTVSTGLAYMHVGSTLCFKHEAGEQEELKVEKITVVENFGASYRTCDFTLDFKSYSACLGSDSCWNSKECHQGVRYSMIGPKAYSVPEAQTGCRLVPNMDDPCVYRQKCVWFYWDIVPTKDKCDMIYHKLGEDRMVHITHKSAKGDMIPFSLSLNNPHTTDPLPIHLGTVTTEYYPVYHSVRKHGDIPLGVNAARINEGQAGLLGDLQVPVVTSNSSANWSYPTHEVVCQPDGRTVMCRTAPPAYGLTIVENSRAVLEGTFDESNLLFRRVRDVKGVASLMMRVAPIISQIVEQASCEVEVVSTYGCSACQEMPYIIVKPRSVATTGLLRFSSNCSFFIPEVSCSEQAQLLRLTSRPSYCTLKFPNTNQTLAIHIGYEFLGQIYYRGVMTFKPEETFSSKMKLALQSPDFLTSLQYSMTLGLITAGAVGLIRTLLKFLAFKRGMKEEREIAE